MKKIPSIFQRLERSSLVNVDNVMPECTWVFEENAQMLITVKHDGTPVRYKNGVFQQRRTLKSKLDPGTEGIPQPKDFELCQVGPTFDDESKQWEWPGWVPLETQFKALVDEAVVSRGGMKSEEDNYTFELCGPKINGNPEGWDTHHLFIHGDQVVQCVEQGTLTVPLLLSLIKSLPYEGVVIYEGCGEMRMAKLKRRDLGLSWPIKIEQEVDV